MNVICISTAMRPQLLKQTLLSLADNAADWSQHHLTVVIDGPEHWMYRDRLKEPLPANVLIKTSQNVGASAARNIGAGSIPRYRRLEHVMFVDDDCYFVNKWDDRLTELAYWRGASILSGYSHPFNQCEPFSAHGLSYGEPLVISSVAMMMPWKIFDECGPWDEPGGPGASEDYAISMRAKDRGYGFAVTSPQCVLHTGMYSSKGEQIVGYNELAEQNQKLLEIHGLTGKVVFG